MPLPIIVRVPTDAVSSIRERLQQSIDVARNQLVQSATLAALTDISEHVPIETGETRDNWQSESERIAGATPNEVSDHISAQSATNTAPQSIYLEYGTIHMSPRPTAGPALTSLRSLLDSLFRLIS